MEYTVENVERMVTEFYRAGQGQANCHDWLQKAQSSPSSWGWAFSLIQPAKSVEVQFYGANTLAIKVSKCWSEVPADQAAPLHEQLVELLRAYSNQGPKIVTTRLAVAVAAITIHRMTATKSDVIVNIVSTFQNDMQAKGVHVLATLLELLTIIPEEFATMVMPSARRNAIRAELTACLPIILDIIVKIVQQEGMATDITVNNLKCMQAWMQFGVPADVIPTLFDQVYNLVRHEEVFDQSLDTMSCIISLPDVQKQPKTVHYLLMKILTLDQQMERWIAEDSFEMALPLANLFIAFGESHSRFLIDIAIESNEGRELALRMVKAILGITGCRGQFPTQEKISEMSLSFWYILQDDITASDPPQHQQCLSIFGGVFSTLVQSLLRKSMYPIDDSSWSAEQKEGFRCYRTDIADAIMYCYNILHENLLNLLLSQLDDAIVRSNMGHRDVWPEMEACLNAWSALGESVTDEEECPQLVQLLSKLPAIPYGNNSKVIIAALDCIGGFSEWLANYPNVISSILPIVLEAVGKPDLAVSATLALKDIVREGKQHLRPYTNQILNTCHSALQSTELKASERARLLYPVGKMLVGLPVQECMSHLERILTPFFVDLQRAASEEPTPAVKSNVLFILKSITMLFQALDQGGSGSEEAESQQAVKAAQPTAILFPQLFPILKALIFKWVNDGEVMDCSWSFLKHSSLILFDCQTSVVEDVLAFIGMFYAAKPHETAFDLVKQLLLLSRQHTQYKPAMQVLIAGMVEATLQTLQTTHSISDYADLIASFFLLMAHFVKKDLEFLLAAGVNLESVFHCAAMCVTLPEVSAVKASVSFLVAFVAKSREVQGLHRVVHMRGEFLLLNVLTVAGKEGRRAFMDYYADVIMTLNKKYFDDLNLWMSNFVKDSSKAGKLTSVQKEQFSHAILQERANKRKLVEILQEFSISCEEP